MSTTTNPTSAPDSPVQQAAGGGAAVQPSDTPLSPMIAAFLAVITPPWTSLNSSLQSLAPSESMHHDKVGLAREGVIGLVVKMVQATPVLSSLSADALNAVLNDAETCDNLAAFCNTMAAAATATARLRREFAWQVASGAIAIGRKMATHNAVVATSIAAIDAAMAKGPKAQQASHVAINEQAKAAKATEKATKATEKATAATARATALQHGTGDATITQPAPSAPAPSTAAPSASAPEAPPAAPASTTIR